MCFLRPTRENVKMLKEELKAPRFQQYHICTLACWNVWGLRQMVLTAGCGGVCFSGYARAQGCGAAHRLSAVFTNLVNINHLQELAEVDSSKEVVQEVQVRSLNV